MDDDGDVGFHVLGCRVDMRWRKKEIRSSIQSVLNMSLVSPTSEARTPSSVASLTNQTSGSRDVQRTDAHLTFSHLSTKADTFPPPGVRTAPYL